MVGDITGDLDCRLGGGVFPGFRDRSPALVADAPVVGREARFQDENLGATVIGRRELATGDDLDDPTRPDPAESQEGGDFGRRTLAIFRVVHALLGFGEFQADRVGTAAQEPDRAAKRGLFARLHPGVNQGCLAIVDPEPGGVVGLDDELIVAGRGGLDQSFPTRGELVRLELLGVGAGDSEVESDGRVGPLDRRVVTAPRPPVVVISAAKAAEFERGGRLAEAGDQVGDGVLVLADREPRQFDPGWGDPGACDRRIEGVVNEGGHRAGLVPLAFPGGVGRHRLIDQLREARDRPLAGQGLRVFFGDTLAVLAVT